MQLHDRFEWDPSKAEANARKHGVTFVEAAQVLADPMADTFHVERQQDADDEPRTLTFANYPENRDVVLAIVWTERTYWEVTCTRIISARRAEPWEKRAYEKEIYQR